MKKESTIYDIARILNISSATVSRALSDHPAINSQTKIKVAKVAEEIGYQSNKFASSLRKQRTFTIGVIIPKLNSFVIASILASIEKVLNENNYNLIIAQSFESETKEIENAKSFYNNRVDALLVSFSFYTQNINHILPFIKKKKPILFFDRIIEHPECISIVIDNYQQAYNATQHLLDQGCENLLHVTGSLNRNVYQDRLEGFKKALQNANKNFNEHNVLLTQLDEDTPYEVLNHVKKYACDGIFFANDSSAANSIIALKKEGYIIPKDIAIVGFNNEPISKVVEPNLTTVHYPTLEMGQIAAQTILNHLNQVNQIATGTTITLHAELIIRESSIRC